MTARQYKRRLMMALRTVCENYPFAIDDMENTPNVTLDEVSVSFLRQVVTDDALRDLVRDALLGVDMAGRPR